MPPILISSSMYFDKSLHLDIPAITDPSVGQDITKFAHLTLAEQQDIQAKTLAQYDYLGVVDNEEISEEFPDSYVLPQCRRGMTMAQLETLVAKSNEDVRETIKPIIEQQKKYGTSYKNII